MLAKAKFTFLLLLMVLGYQKNLLAQTPFWSQDFAGGIPAGWSNVDQMPSGVLWTWCDNAGGTGCAAGEFTTGSNVLSTTQANGYVLVDSDLAGDVNHTSTLTTQAINCTGKSSVFIRFQTYIRTYTFPAVSAAILQVSDNNSTWEDFTIFPDMLEAGNENSANPHIPVIDISTVAANKPAVYIRWVWTANYDYIWCLDDIELLDSNPLPPNDLRVNTNFYAIAPNLFTPKSQVAPIGFLADVANVGSAEQTSVNLNITITNVNSGATAYTEDLAYGAIPASTTIENMLFANPGFTPPATEQVYEGAYNISATAVDMIPDNNEVLFQFAVTDTLFAKENGATREVTPAESGWNGTPPYSWAYGNNYHITNGTGKFARYAIFSCLGTPETAGKTLSLNLYKWVEAGEIMPASDVFAVTASQNERNLVGYANYTITGEEVLDNLIAVRLNNFENDNLPIALESNTNYILMVEYEAESDEQFFLGASEAFDYSATVFRAETLASPDYYAGLLGVANSLAEEEYSTVGFGKDIVPVVRLSIGANPLVGTEDVLSAANKLELSPNPANAEIKLSMDLEQNQADVQVILSDITGKRIWSKSYSDVKTANYTYNTAALSNGIYTVQVITPAGTRSLKAVVQH